MEPTHADRESPAYAPRCLHGNCLTIRMTYVNFTYSHHIALNGAADLSPLRGIKKP